VEALTPGPGQPDDDAVEGRVTSESPERFIPLSWRKVLWPGLRGQLLAFALGIPVAFGITLLVLFFGSVIARQSIGFWDCLRWTYIMLVGINALASLWSYVYIGWRARRQRSPYRLMFEAVYVCKLRSAPETKYRHRHMTRIEIEALVMGHRRGKQFSAYLANAILGGLLSGFGRRPSGSSRLF
jgi:hypothetical protein